MLSSVRSGLVCSATTPPYVLTGALPRQSRTARLAEFPVPGFFAVAALAGPVGVQPAVAGGVGGHPLVLRGAELVDAAAEVDRYAPAVVRRAGQGGQGRLASVQVDLRG